MLIKNIIFLALALANMPVSAESPAMNTLAPNCSLSNIKDGQPLDLSRFRGKVIYLDFWASWCTSCLQSFPFMNSLHNELHAKGLEVVAVNLDEDKQLALDFLEKKPVRFLIAQDTQQSCPTQFSVQGMPSTFLIDKQGKLVKAHVGYKPSDAESLRKEIESLL